MINSFNGKYRFLSNFWPCEISYNLRRYPTVEHAYQACKTLDEEYIKAILQARTPGEAKRLGRECPIRPEWDNVKLIVMYNLLDLKFHQAYLRKRLLETGDENLVEGNTWGDTFWGMCDGVGENHLGRLLMKIRDELQNE